MERLTNLHDNNTTMDTDCPKYRPFSLPNLRIKVRKAKYSTSLDSRGYIPVYEYTINNQPIMWDRETGYVHFTGIWKALNNSKSDIVKMVDSNPELKVKKIRGGFLKIQGTWVPYDYAFILCKRTAWHIRKELTALFGPKFSNEALEPLHEHYGCLLLDPKNAARHGANGRRNSNFTATMKQVRNHQPYPTIKNENPNNCKMVSPFKRKSSQSKQNEKYKKNVLLLDTKEKNQRQKQVENNHLMATTNNMSLSRLLNDDQQHHQYQYHHRNSADSVLSTRSDSSLSSLSSLSSSSSFQLLSPINDIFISEDDHSHHITESPNTTPSPTLDTISYIYDDQKWKPSSFSIKSINATTTFLPPIVNDHHPYYTSSTSTTSSLPKITPIYPSYWQNEMNPSTASYSSALNQDIIDTINATVLLQKLSQDDGKRPFRPMSSSTIPSRVVVGDQEYKICWD